MAGQPTAIIVGAGPAGLACAATMGAAGLGVTVLEKADQVGSVWRRHYDRLHLHTDRNHSDQPGMAMARTFPAYPSREQMVEYLEGYAARFDIRPIFNTTVSRVRHEGTQWRADAGPSSVSAPVIVVATGIADAPYRRSWPGSDIPSKSGRSQQRLSQPRPVCGQARAGGRFRQFGRRDRSGPG